MSLLSYALTTVANAKEFIGIATSNTDYDTFIENRINNSTAIIETICRRRFYATSYTNEKYDGTGSPYLFLKNYPVNTISRLAIKSIDAIKIKCTSTNTTATVSVTSAAVVIAKDGSTIDTATFASYTTLNDIVTQINTNSGWTAELLSSNYSSYKSTELLERFGANAINSNWVSLKIPDEAEDDFEVYGSEGIIYYPGVFPRGRKNIIVSYNAGETTIPYDIQEACNLAVREFYNMMLNEGGVRSEHMGNYSYTFDALSKATQDKIKSLIIARKRHRIF